MAVSTEERRIVTVLFADMAGSTAPGEPLDPEGMRRGLAPYYAIARACGGTHGGAGGKVRGGSGTAALGAPAPRGATPAPRAARPGGARGTARAKSRRVGRGGARKRRP